MLRFLRAGNKHTKTIWWVLIVVTVVTFLGGFVFLLGSGLSAGFNARATGAIGTVNGDPIGHTEYTNALAQQRESYKQQYGTDPTDRDLKALETQTWRSLVYQRLMAQQARNSGLKATDPEVVLALKTSPPGELQTSPSFQTNGQFDYQKYQQALQDPNNNWAPFEQLMRQQIPTRKFQERMLASIKVSDPELLDTYKQRNEKLDATLVQVTPDMSGPAPSLSDADLDRVYKKYQSRFMASAHTELEVLSVPKKFGNDEVRTAHDMAMGLVRRARGGEDFTALARDYSEGPAADKGGVIARAFQPSDFEPSLGARIAALKPGDILDPFQDLSRFVIIKRLPPDSTTPPNGIRMAQIVVRVRPSETEIRAQFDETKKLRDQAKHDGLGKVASAHGLATSTTGPYDAGNTPQQLYPVPEAADWGMGAKLHDVSPVFEGPDEYVICQVIHQEGAGIPPRSEVEPTLRQIAEVDARIQRGKSKIDAVASAVHQGKTLEDAAAAAGLQTFKLARMTRAQPDPRVSNAPEVIGAMFGATPGSVVGPVETINGWFLARVDQRTPADLTAYTAQKAQLMNEMLEQRQRMFLGSYLNELRRRSKIQDLRVETLAQQQ